MKNKVKEIGDRIDLTAGITIQKASSLEYGQVEVIVSNSSVDRHGESILMQGISTKEVMRNPVVLWAHDYTGLPIGKIEKLWKSGADLKARISLAYDIYEFADTVYQMIQKGIINAVSIGGIVKAFGKDDNGVTDYSVISQLEMVELSFVPVGAHPDALVTAKSLNMDLGTLKLQYEDFLRKSLVDKMRTLPENTIKQHINSLKSLISALESTELETTAPNQTKINSEMVRKRKLIVLRSTAKQVDKTAELLIASINNKIQQ